MTKLTVDIVVRRGAKFLFIKRKNDPFKGMLALPGGFVDDGEQVERAASRELREETGVEIHWSHLKLIGVYSKLGRDPRGYVVSIAYMGEVPEHTQVVAGDDAAEAMWMSIGKALEVGMAFDHDRILYDTWSKYYPVDAS